MEVLLNTILRSKAHQEIVSSKLEIKEEDLKFDLFDGVKSKLIGTILPEMLEASRKKLYGKGSGKSKTLKGNGDVGSRNGKMININKKSVLSNLRNKSKDHRRKSKNGGSSFINGHSSTKGGLDNDLTSS